MTARFWPRRWARAIACRSLCGFQSLSNSTTVSACAAPGASPGRLADHWELQNCSIAVSANAAGQRLGTGRHGHAAPSTFMTVASDFASRKQLLMYIGTGNRERLCVTTNDGRLHMNSLWRDPCRGQVDAQAASTGAEQEHVRHRRVGRAAVIAVRCTTIERHNTTLPHTTSCGEFTMLGPRAHARMR